MAKTYAEIVAEAKSKDYGTKVKLYESMRRVVGEYHKTDYKAQSDQWRTKFTELNKNAREGSKGAVKSITELMRDKTALSVADKRLLAAYARDLAARSGGHSFNGEQEFRRMITKSEPGADQTGDYSGRFVNPAEIKGRVADDLGSTAAYPPDSPMRYYLTKRSLDAGLFTDDEMRAIVGEEAWQAYLAHKDDPEYDGARIAGIGDRILLGNVDTPDLDKLKDEAVRASKVKDADVPEFVYAPSKAETEAQGKLDALGMELADADAAGVSVDEHPGPARWYGMTDQEAAKFVSKPAMQRWAKSWGLTDIGHVEDGAFVPGKDTKKAFRLAAHQSFNATTKPMGEFKAEVLAGEPAQRVVLTPDVNGVVGAVWMVNADGSIDKMDLATGEVTPARDARGTWASEADKASYATDAKADPPHPYGRKGERGWTREELGKHGPIDLIAEEDITSDPRELRADRKDRVVGLRRLPNWGEDPDHSAMVQQEDGSVVALHRDAVGQPWRIVSGEAIHKDVGLPDDRPMADEPKAEKVPETKPIAAAPVSAADQKMVADMADELQKGGEKLKEDEARHQVREATGLTALEASTRAEEEKAARSFMARPMPTDEAPVVATQAPVTPGKAVVAPPYEEPVPVDSPALKQAEADWEERHRPGAFTAKDISAIVGRREVKDLGAEIEAGRQAMVDAARSERADAPLFKGKGTVMVDALKRAKEEPFFKGSGTVTVEPTPEEEKAADALQFKGSGTVTPEGQVSDGSVTKEALRRLRLRAGG